MDWFNSFLFYKNYATLQAIGWITCVFLMFIPKVSDFLIILTALIAIVYAGIALVYLSFVISQ